MIPDFKNVVPMVVENTGRGERAYDGKKFEYEIFKDAPGGHSLDRIDTRLAKETRLKIYRFLGGYLKPPHPFLDLADLEKAAYR